MSKIDRVVKEMNDDGLLICDPMSIYYLTDYYNEPHERVYLMLLRKDGNHQLFFNNLFYVEEDLGIPITWFSDTDDALGIVCESLKDIKTLGIDKSMPARWLLPIIEKTGIQCVLDHTVDHVRQIKDEEEKNLMRQASLTNDTSMGKIKEFLLNDLSEEEVGDELLKVYRSLGATDHSFEPIIAYGAHGANPHHMNGETHLTPGDAIICDVGCIQDGYCSDMTRTFFYKEVSPLQKEVYELVLKAQLAAEAAIKPGVKLSDIDEVARSIIREGGYDKEFNHRLGHFIGREVHELGEVSGSSDIIAKPGMIFSIEPGIYLKDQFGVRIEDLVLVTEDGCEVLNHYPKELTVIG